MLIVSIGVKKKKSLSLVFGPPKILVNEWIKKLCY